MTIITNNTGVFYVNKPPQEVVKQLVEKGYVKAYRYPSLEKEVFVTNADVVEKYVAPQKYERGTY